MRERRVSSGNGADRNEPVEVVAEIGGLHIHPAGRSGTHAKLEIDRFLRAHVGARAGAADHVFGARRREPFMYAREQCQLF